MTRTTVHLSVFEIGVGCPMCGSGHGWVWECVCPQGFRHIGQAATKKLAQAAALHFIHAQGWRVDGFQETKDFFAELSAMDESP